VVIVLMMGVGELGQRLLINQRLSTAASLIGDLITHETSLTANRLATVFDAASRLINQDDFANDGTVIITGIGGEPGGVRRVLWQERGTGTLDEQSRIGTPGQVANLPADLTIAAGRTVVAVEIFYHRQSLFGFMLPNDTIVKTSIHRGRTGELPAIAPDT